MDAHGAKAGDAAGSASPAGHCTGALGQDRSLIGRIKDKRTVREDVMAFLDELAKQPHLAPCIVVLDNAGIHKGEPMEAKRRRWEQQGLICITCLRTARN